jgi:hypothetical protein
MKELFNYDTINESHKEAAEEIFDLLSSSGQPVLAELVKTKFRLLPKNRFDMNNTEFITRCKDSQIFAALQGWITEDGVDYPVVSITEDIRKLEEFIKK